jgi:hypothetical protein
MGITRQGSNLPNGSYVPDIWSKKLLKKFYAASICNIICNTDWQGEVVNGQKVVIRQRPDLFVEPYVANQKTNWQDILDISQNLTIDYAFVAAAKLDVVDMHQMDINLQAELIDEIANRLRLVIETTVLGSAYSSAGTSLSAVAWQTSTNCMDAIAQAQAALSVTTEPAPVTERYLVLHPSMSRYLIQQAGLYALNAGLPQSAMVKGSVNNLANFDFYQTPLVPGAGTTGSPFKAFAGHKVAITLATQFTQFETNIPLVDYVGKGIRAINCFGYKVVKPSALVYMPTTIS